MDFSQTSISLHRPLTSYSKVQQAIAAVIRNRRAFMNFKTNNLYLDVGCGPNDYPDFINLDWGWHPGIDICCDVTKGVPLGDEYVRGIFTEHCLEHLPYEAMPFVLGEFYRVMRSDTVLRIVVPDLEIYAKALVSGSPMPYGANEPTSAFSFNRIFYGNDHRFIYDYGTLAMLLTESGFSQIDHKSYGEGANPELIRDTKERAIESLYVEACKA
jgi:predicted SAM-dependent methyltransferase